MQSTDHVEFVKLMATSGEVYGKEITKELCAIYWELLREWRIDEVRDGFMHILKTKVFFPKPAELIEHIRHEHYEMEDAFREAIKDDRDRTSRLKWAAYEERRVLNGA